jgi:hypothetical protein
MIFPIDVNMYACISGRRTVEIPEIGLRKDLETASAI